MLFAEANFNSVKVFVINNVSMTNFKQMIFALESLIVAQK